MSGERCGRKVVDDLGEMLHGCDSVKPTSGLGVLDRELGIGRGGVASRSGASTLTRGSED